MVLKNARNVYRNVHTYITPVTYIYIYIYKYVNIHAGLLARLKDGETIVIAEGYMWEFERRGYLKGGGFIPEVVIEHPDKVRSMHEEFAHAGSDVLVAFTVSSISVQKE